MVQFDLKAGAFLKPESIFRTNKVLPFLKTLPFTYIMPIQQVSFAGDPDYVLCLQGRFVALELKAAGCKPRPLQDYKLNKIKHKRNVGYYNPKHPPSNDLQ